MARVISPDGSSGVVPDDQVPAAIESGYRLETAGDVKEAGLKKQYGDRPLTAGALGAARGLSFGLSDLLLQKTGLAKAESLREFKRQNETASDVGEYGAILGSAITGTGLVGGLTKGAGGVAAKLAGGEGAASTIARTGISGGIEGGFYGAGQAVSEAALGDQDLTAEKLVSRAGLGALTGAGVGVGAATLGEGIKKLLKYSDILPKGNVSLSEGLKDQAERQAVKAVAGNGHLRELKLMDAKGNLNAAGEYALKNDVISFANSPDDMVAKLTSLQEEAGQKMDDILSNAKGAAVNADDIALRARKELVNKYAKGNLGDRKIAQRLEDEIALFEREGNLSLRQVEEMKSSFDKYLKFGAEQSPTQEALKDLRKIFKEETEKALDKAAPGLGEEFIKAKRDYGLSSELRDLAENRVLQLQNNNTFGLNDYLSGSIAGSVGGGPIGSIAGMLGNKLLRNKGSQAGALLLNKLSQSAESGLLAKAFGSKVRQQFGEMPEMFGPYRNFISSLAAKGDNELFAGHAYQYANDENYRRQMEGLGYAQEDGTDRFGTTQKLTALAGIDRANKDYDKNLDSAIDSLVGGSKVALSEVRPSRDQLLKQHGVALKNLAELRANVAHASNVLSTGDIGDHAPGVATAATAVASRAVEFLDSKLPKDPYSSLPESARPKWVPSDSDLIKFNRYVRAVDDPLNAIKDMSVGRVTQETIEALQSIYPSIYDDLKVKLINKMSDQKKRLTPNQRRMLSTLLGTPELDAQPMNPGTSGQPSGPGQSEQQQMSKPKMPKTPVSNMMQTQSQRIEGR